jgi:hypothetical protein
MEAEMPTDLAESSKPTLGVVRGALEVIVRWVARFGPTSDKPTKYFLQSRFAATDNTAQQPTSDITAERCADSLPEEPRVVATATEGVVAAKPNATVSITAPAIAGAEVGQQTQIERVAAALPDQQEILRRRELVRTLFNDFWSGSDDKPKAFVDRLDQAETYLNERLTACGESWQLDAETRAMLGLPRKQTKHVSKAP